ncbi:MAG TPA: twin-arginine translocase TatA/TatE family subunit [Kofleriaceae bacterium]
MFGIGGSEILVILVVALLFLGPDKLPDAAKTISKGIRDLKRQSRALQQQIEGDEKIGGAIRDLKSALRGEDAPVRPPVRIQPPKVEEPAAIEGSESTEAALEEPKPRLTLPETAGEPDPDVHDDDGDIGSLIKPAAGTVAKADVVAGDDEPKQKHG